MASSRPYTPPCAACKVLRRKCIPSDCVFWPYFPPQEHQKFENVRKVFRAGNVAKLLNEVPHHQRQDAVNSLAYEAEVRVRDPVYGCVGLIATLQRQVHRLQKELDAANAQLINFVCGEIPSATEMTVPVGFDGDGDGGGGGGAGGRFYQTPALHEVDIYNPYNGGMDGSSTHSVLEEFAHFPHLEVSHQFAHYLKRKH